MFDVFVKLYGSSLHRNAGYMILSSAAIALLGFVFWNLAARLYEPEAIGAASALVSAMNLLATLSLLGVTIIIIRFFSQTPNKGSLVSTAYTVSLLVSGALAIVYILGIDFFSPALSNIVQGIIVVIFLLVCWVHR